jgi:CRISPR-associated protein Cas2
MTVLLLYDIANDRARTKAADICLDYGLSRIQYSAFLGDITAARREELLAKLRRLLHDQDARVHLFPLCEKDARLARAVVQGEMAATPPFGPAR